MSTEPAARKKKMSTETVKRSPQDDHRRKRRNRMTQSCLNCHTSKRMCDRKRPCGRCTQLGLTGLCVYEVDDPNQRNDVSDEEHRLQKRVAELESVIRELKNKPQPRWAQAARKRTDSETKDMSAQQVHDGGVDHHHLTAYYTPSLTPSPTPPSVITPSGSSRNSPACDPSTAVVHTPPSPLCLTPVGGLNVRPVFTEPDPEMTSLLTSCLNDTATFDNIFDGLIGRDSASFAADSFINHQLALAGELSLRLRRAADVLRQIPSHSTASACSLQQCITALDRLTSETLGNTFTPLSPSCPPQPGRQSWQTRADTLYAPPCEDTFMTWDSSRVSEWQQLSGRSC